MASWSNKAATMPGMLVGTKVYLAPFFAGTSVYDLIHSYMIRSEPEVGRWFFSEKPPTMAAHLRWIADYLEREDDFYFSINEKRDDLVTNLLGFCGVYNVRDGAGEFGRLALWPSQHGKGYGSDAIATLLRWATHGLGLERLHLKVKANNYPARAVYQKCGFVQTLCENGVITMEARRPE